jgi:hypothetical protein
MSKGMTVGEARQYLAGQTKPEYHEYISKRLAGDFAVEIAAEVRRLHTFELERNALLDMTAMFDAHPEGYDGPCICRECLSLCDAGDFDG